MDQELMKNNTYVTSGRCECTRSSQRQFVTRTVYILLNADSNRTFFSLCFNDWQRNALHAWRAPNSLLLLLLLIRWQQFSAGNDVMTAILKVWHQIENPTASVDTNLLENPIPAKFHPDLIWNDGALGFLFRRGRLNKNKMNSDMRSVPDPKSQSVVRHGRRRVCGKIS